MTNKSLNVELNIRPTPWNMVSTYLEIETIFRMALDPAINIWLSS